MHRRLGFTSYCRSLELIIGAGFISLVACGTTFGEVGTSPYHFVDLYTLTPPSGLGTQIATGELQSVDTDGAAIGSANDRNDHGHALLWDNRGNVLDLHPSGYVGSQVRGIKGGQKVGFASVGSASPVSHAMLWDSNNQAIDLQPATGAYGLSSAEGTDGSQQVGDAIASDGNLHAMLWNGSNVAIDLNPPGYTESYANGVSHGQQVGAGYSASQRNYHALLWSGSNLAVDLAPLTMHYSVAMGTNGEQQVGYGVPIGGNLQHALLWHGNNQAIDLQPLGFNFSEARATNGTQQIGVGVVEPDGVGYFHGLVWNGTNVAIDLQTFLPANFVASEPASIDSGGDIFGTAYDPATGQHVVEWVPVPEPASAALLAISLVVAIRVRKGRSSA